MRVTSCGTTLSVSTFGDEDAQKTVIILTGDGRSGSASETWRQLVPVLVEGGARVVAFDFYGLGESRGRYEDLTLSRGIENLKDVLHAVGRASDGRLVLVGASFGGAVALNAVCDGVVAPDLLVLKSPATYLYEAYEHEQGDFGNLLAWRETGVSPVTGQSFGVYLDALAHQPDISNIACRTVVFQGDGDRTVAAQQSLRLASQNERVELRILHGVDHGYKEEGAMDFFVRGCAELVRGL